MAAKHPAKADDFVLLLDEVKQRIQLAQTRAVLAVNSELVRLYWDIGRIIHVRQRREGWGAAVIPRLAAELKNELPDVKGFSERNIGRMIAFYRSYPEPSAILPQPVAKLTTATEKRPQSGALAPSSNLPQPVAQLTDSLLWSVPWAHHVVLMEKVPDALPKQLSSALPTVEEIEAELMEVVKTKQAAGRKKKGGGELTSCTST